MSFLKVGITALPKQLNTLPTDAVCCCRAASNHLGHPGPTHQAGLPPTDRQTGRQPAIVPSKKSSRSRALPLPCPAPALPCPALRPALPIPPPRPLPSPSPLPLHARLVCQSGIVAVLVMHSLDGRTDGRTDGRRRRTDQRLRRTRTTRRDGGTEGGGFINM